MHRRLSAAFVSLSFLLALTAGPAQVLAEEAAAEGAAAPVAVGQAFPVRALEDQHGQPVKLGADTDLVLLSFNMELSKSIHGFLSEKDPDYLATHRTQYVSDIAKMPGIITFLFAGPKMRKYPFPIILNEADDFGPLFPQEEEKITAVSLDDKGAVASIAFFDSMEEVEQTYWAAE
jgi:hypothetical protein